MPEQAALGSGATPRVLVVQRRLTHYRVPFFEGVQARLADSGIRFTLAHGEPTPQEHEKRDEGVMDAALRLPTHYWLDGRLCWQPLAPLLAQHDYVVVPQENKMLNNLPLLLGRRHCRVGLWGHGRNFQSAGACTAGLAQRLKAALSRQADWWFAYTEFSAEVVRGFGYPAERITVLNNTIDTAALARAIAQARATPVPALRTAHGLPANGPLGLYLGSLYAEKRLDLLVDGAERLRAGHPDLHVAVVGAGPEAAWLRQRASGLPWLHILGPRQGRDKAELLACADVMLNPGLVGLGILDAFVAGLPMVTTDCDLHSPEIAYLRHGDNGLMSAPTAEAFARALDSVLNDAPLAQRLREGSLRSAVDYGMAAMVERFCTGMHAWAASSRLCDSAAARPRAST